MKRRIFYFLLNRRLNKKPPLSLQPKPWDEIKKIIVLIHKNTLTQEILNTVDDYFTKQGKEVYWIIMANNSIKNQWNKNVKLTSKPPIILTNKDCNWLGIPKSKAVKRLMVNPSDMLIFWNFTSHMHHRSFIWISYLANSHCKIGFNQIASWSDMTINLPHEYTTIQVLNSLEKNYKQLFH
ncbi:MAG: hypothetical protein KatS3mg034_0819 [Vicingaceae bacterium]|nr:MAG: hypothetical protein KatS3mg034_0819 [Vicingaceae bacterium]